MKSSDTLSAIGLTSTHHIYIFLNSSLLFTSKEEIEQEKQQEEHLDNMLIEELQQFCLPFHNY